MFFSVAFVFKGCESSVSMTLAKLPSTHLAVPATSADLVAAVEARQFSDASKATMRTSLRAWAFVLGYEDLKDASGNVTEKAEVRVQWHALTIDDVDRGRARLIKRLRRENKKPSPYTLRIRFAALRALFKEARRRRFVDQLFCDDVADSLRRIPGSRSPKGRALSEQEVSALLKACDMDRQPRGAMLRAILLIGLGTGMRRAELCKLGIECFDGRAIHVVAKGDHEVQHFLTPATKLALVEWLKIRRGLRWNHKYLFASPVHGTRLRPWHLWYLFIGRKGDAGLCKLANVAPFRPHDIRRSFATKMFSGGLGTSVVQKLMHHANQETTTRYDLRGDAELEKERLKVADYGAGV